MTDKFDVAIIGAGVLGSTLAFWLSELYEDRKIALIEKEATPAAHTSFRNTGVIHRPFYVNPEKKKIFAKSAQKSYFLWKSLAKKFNLAWREVGTLEIATEDPQLKTLEEYKRWSVSNGMNENETELLDSKGVKDIEKEVSCRGALFSKTDTSVDYRQLTNCVFNLAVENGVEFLSESEVKSIKETDGVEIGFKSGKTISSSFLVNAAGGNSLDIAHMLGLAKEYTDLHFRGEYWQVDEPFASKITHNVYSVAKYKEFPFLDPHFIRRADDRREIGPNALLVFSPDAYSKLASKKKDILTKIFESPNYPKLRLFFNSRFLSLVAGEWYSSISKRAMCKRVEKFIPSLGVSYLSKRGVAGVRSFLIDKNGFVPEAVLAEGKSSLHILNYNSPGATGAPAFSTYVISNLQNRGFLSHPTQAKQKHAIWNFEENVIRGA